MEIEREKEREVRRVRKKETSQGSKRGRDREIKPEREADRM